MDIRLPDGSIRSFDAPITGEEFAKSIGTGLYKAAVALKINGEQKDLKTTITTDCDVAIITKDTEEGLEIMRHTVAAQLLARAVKNLYPNAKLAIGPTIENGFYYDVAFEEAISPEDLGKIEKEMRRIQGSGDEIDMKLHSRADALKMFEERKETYKMDIINRTEGSDEFQIYHQGEAGFIDLCRGPHLPSLKKVGAFKLLKIAGAYWRGDSSNEMLTRIYGTAWNSDKELNAYLNMLEEAEKRDHRKLGQEMDLFHLQNEAPGQVFWHAGGWTLFVELQNYIREKLRQYDYQEVNTPQIVSKDLYIKSGHWDKFGTKNMFITQAYDKEHALKPMNCPCHVQIFNQGVKSYRDLPIRMSEFGTCMRHESHGALHGIMRVASMIQDDAHIFCTTEQIESEVVILCELIKEIYAEFGFDKILVKFSDRPDERVGSDEVWDMAEEALKSACAAASLEWELNPGEGAFYGPKLEFTLIDAIGRHWQCGTVQMDFNLPKRLDAEFVGADGNRTAPVMIHRALLGSLERFTGILVEHFAGNFPLWLAPQQLVVSAVTDKQNEAVEKLVAQFKEAGFRVSGDYRNEKINYKIREHMLKKVAMVAIIGDREIEEGTMTIRRLGSNAQTTYKVEELLSLMEGEVKNRLLPPHMREEEKKSA